VPAHNWAFDAADDTTAPFSLALDGIMAQAAQYLMVKSRLTVTGHVHVAPFAAGFDGPGLFIRRPPRKAFFLKTRPAAILIRRMNESKWLSKGF
jgi:hypothetical protein